MSIVKLERVSNLGHIPLEPPVYIYLNTDRIESFASSKPGVTMVRMASGAQRYVAVEPEDLAASVDPDGACPNPLGQCNYVSHYLAYGGPDLTHAGYHAAEKLARQHAQSCRRYENGKLCLICQSNEERLRA